MYRLLLTPLFFFFTQLSDINAQVDISFISNNLEEESNWYAVNINNRTIQTKNTFLSIQASKDGRLIYKTRTKNILLTQGISIWNKNLLEPIQENINELNNLNDKDRIIIDVLLVDAQNANVISRARENIVFSQKETDDKNKIGNLVKDQFKMQGSINLLGQHSNREGVGSTVPRDFLRADGRTTLSFSALPVDLSFLATTEQSALRQNMNKATARLNVHALKQNFKEIIDEKIAAADTDSNDPSDVEFAQFKNEVVQGEFPDYNKWDTYFRSETGVVVLEKMKTYFAVEELEKSEITSKNFRRFKALAEKKKLSATEAKEKKELHLFVLNVIKLKKEKEKLESELGKDLGETKAGFLYYEEANTYYESLTIKDYKRQNTTLNPFRLLNKTQKFLNMFQGVAIGTTNPYFSKMTLSGLLINGAHVEINPGIFYLSAVYGQSSKETYDDSFSIPNLTLKQNAYGVKAGLGSTSGSHLHFSFIDIKDVDSPISIGSEVTPKSNRIIGTDAAIMLLEDKLKIEGEIVGSMIMRNDNAGELAQNFNNKIPLKPLFPNTNSTSFYDYAFRVGADWNINAAGLQLNGELERLNPNFQSLGAPTLLSNVMRWNAGVRKSFIENKISIGLNARRDDNSLDPLLSSVDNVTEGYGGDITLAFPKAPQIFASYQPFAQNSTIIATGEEQFTDSKITNVNITYPYKFGEKINASSSVTYVNQTLESNIAGAASKNTTYALNQSVNVNPIGINLAASHTPDQLLGDSGSRDINTLNLSVNFNKDKFNSSLGWQLMQIPSQETKTGYQFSAGYKITEAIMFGINAQRNLYDDLVSVNSFNDYVLQGRLQINFGGEKKQEKIDFKETEQVEEKPETLPTSNDNALVQSDTIENKIVEEVIKEEEVVDVAVPIENENGSEIIDKKSIEERDESMVTTETDSETTEKKDKEPIVLPSKDQEELVENILEEDKVPIEKTDNEKDYSTTTPNPQNSELNSDVTYTQKPALNNSKVKDFSAPKKDLDSPSITPIVEEQNTDKSNTIVENRIEPKTNLENPDTQPVVPQQNEAKTTAKTNNQNEETDDVETHVAKPIRLHIGMDKDLTKTNNQNKKADDLDFTSKDNSSHYKVFLGTENHPNKQFLSLMHLGPVYSEKVGNNSYAYYLGHHTDVKKAIGMAEKVKAKGLNARVMQFDKGELKEDNAHLFSENGDGKTTYMVLLNISNDSEEDKKRLKRIKYLGELKQESQERDGYVTTYSIGKLNSYNEAKLLLKKLKIAGFKNAVIGALEDEDREDLATENVSAKKNYMVLLNVLNDSKEENQRLGLLRDLGELKKENEGEDVDLSVYSIGQLMTFNDAKVLLKKVKELGFENVAIGTADK